MAFHHLALAARDIEATHRFYTEAMGFTLVKAEVAPTGSFDGWAKHVFYDTGGQGLIAFWDLHEASIPPDAPTAISEALGYPVWVNHLAFDAGNLDGLDAAKQRWLGHGYHVMEIDHGWCTSMYTTDPNGILVEWCCTTQPFSEADRAEAERVLADPHPPLPDTAARQTLHRPTAAPATAT